MDVHVRRAAVPAARVGEQHAVRLAAQQTDARLRGVGRVELALDGARAWRTHERIRRRIGLRLTRGVATRHALVEQERSGAHGRVAQETTLPDALTSLEIERVAMRPGWSDSATSASRMASAPSRNGSASSATTAASRGHSAASHTSREGSSAMPRTRIGVTASARVANIDARANQAGAEPGAGPPRASSTPAAPNPSMATPIAREAR